MDEKRSIGKLVGLIGFMFFVYINLLCGGVITVALVAAVLHKVIGL
jgi:hypothetical protein